MADKSKTIKNATDQELSELISRLRKEVELQNIISQLKRNSSDGYIPYDYGQGISTETTIESLYHFGIPGMHWGRKKGIKPSTSKNNSEDHNKKVELKKKKLNEMSNAELKSLNERMQLERQFKELTKSQKSSGKKFVMDVLSSTAKQTATTYISKYAAKGLETLLKKK